MTRPITTRAAAPALADRLASQGRQVTACGWCGRVMAADLDHGGQPLNPHNRAYCTPACRTSARNHRRVLTRQPAQVAARALRTALRARHQLEAAGQLDLTGLPLPALDEDEEPVTRDHPTDPVEVTHP